MTGHAAAVRPPDRNGERKNEVTMPWPDQALKVRWTSGPVTVDEPYGIRPQKALFVRLADDYPLLECEPPTRAVRLQSRRPNHRAVSSRAVGRTSSLSVTNGNDVKILAELDPMRHEISIDEALCRARGQLRLEFRAESPVHQRNGPVEVHRLSVCKHQHAGSISSPPLSSRRCGEARPFASVCSGNR